MTEPALLTSLSYYSSYVSAPPVVFGVWIATVGIAVGALAWKTVKGWREGTGAFLFDSAGLCEFLASSLSFAASFQLLKGRKGLDFQPIRD